MLSPPEQPGLFLNLRRLFRRQEQYEFLTDSKGVHRHGDTAVGTRSGLSPDESPLMVLDQSSQELYALDLEAQ